MSKLVFYILIVLLPTWLCAIPQQVIIIRHAEKLIQQDPGPYLSVAGIQRSLALPQYFVQNYPLPVALFAQGPDGTQSSMRPIQTLAPTAMNYAALYPDKAKHFTLQTHYTSAQVKDLANYILSNKDHDSGTVLVCWSRPDMQKLAKHLGVAHAPEWPHGVFNQVWIITYDATTKQVASFTVKTQPFDNELLKGICVK